MESDNPIDLLFGGMEKLGPGNDMDTLHVLRLLPKSDFSIVVDAGCGMGRQTIVLAKELWTTIHAVDSHEPFLHDLAQRARVAGIDHLVQTHCMNMKDIPDLWPRIDLLWSEGAAYNIGFPNALTTWASSITKGGFAVVSELSWLRKEVPHAVRDFFLSAYPDMRSLEENVAVAEHCGYTVLTTHTLPVEAWTDGFYDILESRAKSLSTHPNALVRDFAIETIKEIEAFEQSEGSYGYVFYVLQKNAG